MPETTPLIKAALNLRVGVGFDVYIDDQATYTIIKNYIEKKEGNDRLLLRKRSISGTFSVL